MLLSGDAHIEDGRLVLTDSQQGVQGRYYQYVDVPANFGGMDVSFDLTADQPIKNFGTGGGDGLASSFGDDIETAGTNNPHNGSGTKLRSALMQLTTVQIKEVSIWFMVTIVKIIFQQTIRVLWLTQPICHGRFKQIYLFIFQSMLREELHLQLME